MTLKTVTARLPEETLEEIEAIAGRERIDRSELIRRLLDAALARRRIDGAVEAYREGKVTLWRASEVAGVSLREMMEIIGALKVSVSYTLDDLDRDLEYVRQRKSGMR